MIEHPEKFLATVLLGNTFVNIAAAALATALALNHWPEHGILISTAGITVVLLIFSETTPKTFAAQNTERLTLLAVRPLELISWLFTPLTAVMIWIANGIGRLVGGEPVNQSLATADDIRNMISVGHKEGTVEENEAKMLHKVFDFGDRPVREITIPRPEVIAIEQGSTVADLFSLYADSPLSRFPVFEENMDNVIGILSIKDVLMAQAKGGIDKNTLIDELIRPAYFTPETKLIDDLFNEMQEQNYRMAVVIDEFGGTAGIVSLSRLVEKIVGPVGDELADAEKEYEQISANTYQIDGGMRIEEINEEMELEMPESEDYETIAGFVLSRIGHIPRQGEQLRYRNIKIVITKMRAMKIEEVLLTKERVRVPDEPEKKGP
jgi:putative hemolysin